MHEKYSKYYWKNVLKNIKRFYYEGNMSSVSVIIHFTKFSMKKLTSQLRTSAMQGTHPVGSVRFIEVDYFGQTMYTY